LSLVPKFENGILNSFFETLPISPMVSEHFKSILSSASQMRGPYHFTSEPSSYASTKFYDPITELQVLSLRTSNSHFSDIPTNFTDQPPSFSPAGYQEENM
jgi:hypothetical protein